MKNLARIALFVLLLVLLQSCPTPGTHPPSMTMDHIIILQGNINEGNLTINEQVFVKGESHGFNIKRSTSSFGTYKTDDMYIEETRIKHGSPRSNDDHLSALLQKYRIKTSTDFKGTMYMFIHFKSTYWSGHKKDDKDVYRTFVYGKALANALKVRGITHMDKAQTQPVGAKEHVVIYDNYGNADPESIRVLMQAAKAVNDPRLLIIERESGKGKVNITVFGEETPRTVAAGTVFVWEFGKEELEKLRQFVVKW